MTHENPSQEPVFGYLSTVVSADHGYFGGYLVVSAIGRPLEFHCTAPIRPSRAQEILYGPTLQPFLLGEQIGGTLLGQAKLKPCLILTDQEATLCLSGRSRTPLVQIQLHATNTGESSNLATPSLAGADTRTEIRPRPAWDRKFQFGVYVCELPAGSESDRGRVSELLRILAERVDLAEPFDRIHEAIREAQRIGGRGQDAHGQAA